MGIGIGALICYLLALAAIVGFIIRACMAPRGSRAVWMLIGLVIADVLLTIIPAWNASGASPWFIPAIAYSTIGMVLFEGMADSITSTLLTVPVESLAAEDVFIYQAYIFTLYGCYVATPIVVAMTAFNLITRGFTSARIVMGVRHFLRKNNRQNTSNVAPLYIFSSLNDRSIALARSIVRTDELGGQNITGQPRRKDVFCVFVNVTDDDREANSQVIEEFTNQNVCFYEMGATNLLKAVGEKLVQRARNISIFFLGDRESQDRLNLGFAIDFITEFVKFLPSTSEKRDAAKPMPWADVAKVVSEDRGIEPPGQANGILSEAAESAPPIVFTDKRAQEQFERLCVRICQLQAKRELLANPRYYHGKPRYHITVVTNGESAELALDSIKDTEGIDIRAIEQHREIINQLFWRHPLYETISLEPSCLMEAAERKPTELVDAIADLNVMIVGWGEYGFEAMRASLWVGQIPSVKLHLFVIDRITTEDFLTRFKHRCPAYFCDDYLSVEVISESDNPPSVKLSAGRLFDLIYYSADVETSAFDDAMKAIRLCIIDQVRASEAKVEGLTPIVIGAPTNEAKRATQDAAVGVGRPYCIVSLGDDDLNTDTAIRLSRLLVGDGSDLIVWPDVFIDIYDIRRHGVVESMRTRGAANENRDGTRGREFNFQPFGAMESVFNEKNLTESPLQALAYNVNASYCGMFRRSRDNEDDERVWDRFVRIGKVQPLSSAELHWIECIENFSGFSGWQMNRLSNLANALMIPTELWLLGYELVEDYGSNAGAPVGEAVDNATDSLAATLREIGAFEESGTGNQLFKRTPTLMVMERNEHRRWDAFYRSEGWIGMSPATSNTLKDLGFNNGGRHDSHLLLRHPYICAFDDLQSAAITMGKGDDPTLYDALLMLDLAAIVSDERNLSDHSLTVRRQCLY